MFYLNVRYYSFITKYVKFGVDLHMRNRITGDEQHAEIEGKDIEILKFGLAGGVALRVSGATTVLQAIAEGEALYGNKYDYWKNDEVVTLKPDDSVIAAISLALEEYKEHRYREIPTEGTMTAAEKEMGEKIADDGLSLMTAYCGAVSVLKIIQEDALRAAEEEIKTFANASGIKIHQFSAK